ncbi:MFS transporter [Bacillus coahuilensis]|uniref:MFS transporter n=1 Tax=Bacillus coahuilensis TaxID=408580 RepID=UPI000A8F86EA|nr:MFS transporter [Bacillus coahuilensis]
MSKKRRFDLISVASIPLIMTLGNSMLIPVLPTIEKKLSISSFESSLVITVYSVVAIILIPIAGYLSDQYGRKKIIIPSLFIAGIGGLVSGFASWQLTEPFSIILIGRALQGVGAAGAAPIVLPLVGDMYKKESEVSEGLGLIETSNTFGKVLSPILGAILANLIWFLPFFAFPIFCLLSIVLVIFFVHTPKKKKSEKQTAKEFIGKVKDIFRKDGKWISAIFIIGGILMFILFGILFYLSTMLEEEYGVSSILKGVILAIPLAALCIASFVTGKRIEQNKIVMKWVTVVSLLVLTLGAGVTSFFDGVYFLVGSLLLTGVAIGASLPCLDALITEGIEKEERGTITSLYSSMRFVGVALGPPVFSYLMDKSHFVMFLVIAVLALLSLCVAFFLITPETNKSPKGLLKA